MQAGRAALQVSPSAIDMIAQEALRAFPHEGCGFLVGPRSKLRIDEALPRPNVFPGPRERRFVIDGLEFVRLEEALENTPRTVMGIFHSHPLHPPVPSKTDRSVAWPGLVYLIQAVDAPGHLGPLTAWRLKSPDAAFESVPFEVA